MELAADGRGADAGGVQVRVERVGNEREVFVVVLSRPHAKNAVDSHTAALLHAAFEQFEHDPTAKVGVLWGEHGGFCSGADLKEVSGRVRAMQQASPTALACDPVAPMGPSRMLLSKPVIAAISGHAVAGGLELALWCDLRVAEEDSILGVFCRRFGVPLIDGGTVRLPRIVGTGRALDLILTGRPVTAREALDMGLVNRVVPTGHARREAEALALSIAAHPQACMRADRLSALTNAFSPLADGLRGEYLGAWHVLGSEAAQGAARFARGTGRHGKALSDEQPRRATNSAVLAVVFDVGGVLVDSPVVAVMGLEREKGMEPGSLNKRLAKSAAFTAMERGEIDTREFAAAFELECKAAGLPDIDGTDLMQRIRRVRLRPHYIQAVQRLKALGYKTAIITNNFRQPPGEREVMHPSLAQAMDVVVESRLEGTRKPDPAIFTTTVQRLGVQPHQCVFLDDIPVNVQAAIRVGMQAIRVHPRDKGGVQALRDLEHLLGVQLTSEAKL